MQPWCKTGSRILYPHTTTPIPHHDRRGKRGYVDVQDGYFSFKPLTCGVRQFDTEKRLCWKSGLGNILAMLKNALQLLSLIASSHSAKGESENILRTARLILSFCPIYNLYACLVISLNNLSLFFLFTSFSPHSGNQIFWLPLCYFLVANSVSYVFSSSPFVVLLSLCDLLAFSLSLMLASFVPLFPLSKSLHHQRLCCQRARKITRQARLWLRLSLPTSLQRTKCTLANYTSCCTPLVQQKQHVFFAQYYNEPFAVLVMFLEIVG